MNRNRPTQVAIVRPAYRPAFRPNAQMPNGRSQPGERNAEQRNRNTCCPVVYAKNLVGAGHHPVNQRRLFKVGNAVQPGGYLVAGA